MDDSTPTSPEAILLAALRDEGWLLRLARHLVPTNPADADDLTQDLAVILFSRSRGKQVDPVRVRASLVVALRNRAKNLFRSMARRARREQSAASTERVESTASLVARRDLHSIVARELLALEEPYRTTLLRRFFEDRSPDEIAELDAVPSTTVRWRQHRGIALLRERLDARHHGDRDEWLRALAPLLTNIPTPHAVPLAGTIVMKSNLAVIGASVALLLIGAWLWSSGSVTTGVTETLSQTSSSSSISGPPLAREDSKESVARSPAVAEPVASEPRTVPSPTARLTMRVVDDAGGPIRGAHLIATSISTSGETYATDPRATSDERGFITLDVSPSDSTSQPVANSVSIALVLRADGFVGRIVPTLARVGGGVDLGTFAMGRASSLTGRVVFAGGGGVSGALVSSGPEMPEICPLGDTGELEFPATRSNPDGTFRLDGIPPGNAWILAANERLESTKRIDVALRAGESRELGELTLESTKDADALIAHGIVIDAEGVPVDAARIEIRKSRLPEGGRGRASTTTYTDLTGRFATHVEGDREDPFEIFAFDTRGRFALTSLPARLLDGRAVRISMSRLPLSELCVVDDSGRAVQDFAAYLEILDPADATERLAMTSCFGVRRHFDGRMAIGKPRQPFFVVIDAPGHRSGRFGPFDPISSESIRCTIGRNHSIRGVVTSRGSPVRDAIVCLVRPAKRTDEFPALPVVAGAFLSEGQSAGASVPVRTDSEGRFEIAGNQSGPHRLHVRKAGMGSAESEVFEYDPNRASPTLEIDLPPAATIEGAIEVDPGDRVARRIVGASIGDGFVHTTRTDATGRFRFEDLEPGRWIVAPCAMEVDLDAGFPACEMREHSEDPSPSTTVVLTTGSNATVKLDLRRKDVAILYGRISFPGRAWGPHAVSLDRILDDSKVDRTARRTTSVDPDGTYRLDLPTAGKWRLNVVCSLSSLTIQKDLEIRFGENEWSIEVATGAIEFSPVADYVPLRLERIDPFSGVLFRVDCAAVPGNDRRIEPVFAGSGRLLHLDPGPHESPVVDPTKPAVDIVVPASGTLAVDLN